MIVEKGVHELQDGTWIEAGTLDNVKTSWR